MEELPTIPGTEPDQGNPTEVINPNTQAAASETQPLPQLESDPSTVSPTEQIKTGPRVFSSGSDGETNKYSILKNEDGAVSPTQQISPVEQMSQPAPDTTGSKGMTDSQQVKAVLESENPSDMLSKIRKFFKK